MCIVHGTCFATISGVVRVRGRDFGGPDLFELSVELGGRSIDMNSSLVTLFTLDGDLFSAMDLEDDGFVLKETICRSSAGLVGSKSSWGS